MLHIVDDEDVIRDALDWLAHSRGLAARGYASGQAFLDAWRPCPTARPATRATACCWTCACRA